MSEILGGLYLLLGLAFLTLAIMVPPRATSVFGGIILSMLFFTCAIDRFILGSYQLMAHDPTTMDAARTLMPWAIAKLILTIVLIYGVWRAPASYHVDKKPRD